MLSKTKEGKKKVKGKERKDRKQDRKQEKGREQKERKKKTSSSYRLTLFFSHIPIRIQLFS